MMLLSIVGRKGAGKSQVLETLIRLLKQKGLRVGVIKHLAREDFEIDQPGKDTQRYRLQGAETVMLLGQRKFAVFSQAEEMISLERQLRYFEEFDLVFLEGYLLENIPVLEVYAPELGVPLVSKHTNIFAVCTAKDDMNSLADRIYALSAELSFPPLDGAKDGHVHSAVSTVSFPQFSGGNLKDLRSPPKTCGDDKNRRIPCESR